MRAYVGSDASRALDFRAKRVYSSAWVCSTVWTLTTALMLLGAARLGYAAVAKPADRWQNLKVWALSATAVTQLDGEPGQRGSGFVHPQVARTASGALVVFDPPYGTLNVFSKAGKFVKTLSDGSHAAGSLHGLVRIDHVADSLFAVELPPAGSSVELFTITGGFRSKAFLHARNAPRGLSALARLSGGRYLVNEGRAKAVVGIAPGTFRRDTLTLGILTARGQGTVTWLGKFPGETLFGYRLASRPGERMVGTYRIGPGIAWGTSANRVWIGDSGSGIVSIYGPDGAQLAKFVVPLHRQGFSHSDLQRAKVHAIRAATTDDGRVRAEAMFDLAEQSVLTPLFSKFVPGHDGEMGIERFEIDPFASHEMIVLSAAGRPVARLPLPIGLTLNEFGYDYAVGVQRGGDGKEHVVQFALRR